MNFAVGFKIMALECPPPGCAGRITKEPSSVLQDFCGRRPSVHSDMPVLHYHAQNRSSHHTTEERVVLGPRSLFALSRPARAPVPSSVRGSYVGGGFVA